MAGTSPLAAGPSDSVRRLASTGVATTDTTVVKVLVVGVAVVVRVVVPKWLQVVAVCVVPVK